ncbi:MAG: lytic transglycosylase domain-containing protein [Sphingomicrobium sp.]
MWRITFLLPLALAAATSGSAQAPSYAPQRASAPAVGYALNDWRTLRQSSGYPFANYAGFLITNPDWPEEDKLRRWAEAAMRPGDNAATVLVFFARKTPESGNGWARLADAQTQYQRNAEALAAARNAWAEADLSTTDEQAIWARYGASLTRADHDRRVDALLFAKKPSDAYRFIAMATPTRQGAFYARVAMQSNAADAETRYRSVIGQVTSDAGLMMDRARHLRANNFGVAARQLAGRQHQFIHRPADVERFYEMLLLIAGEAAEARDWSHAYDIARQLDDALPPGADLAQQSYGVRDNYTSLAWLAGRAAFDRLGNYGGAQAMFDRYSKGGKSLQVRTKGEYWAGRAADASGQRAAALGYYGRAATVPSLFYGQLALERIGRPVPAPPQAMPNYVTTPAQRTEFANRRLVQALRIALQQGRANEQTLFVQALAKSLQDDGSRFLALDLSQQLRRPDLAVWVERMARNDGDAFFYRQSYPNLPGVTGDRWTVIHGISRQESSFDPYAISHAGALGTMQLMRGTAREQAGKMGVGYDANRLFDQNYNVSLGSAYFRRMLNNWDGSVPLAVASYNAGSGNVRKWVNGYGDPRSGVDIVRWIEAIPFTETRGYVQRVIENSVVYDSISRTQTQQSAVHVSRYLGKASPG